MKNQNKLLLIITLIGSLSQIVQADGFFHSVGNVATLGELNRSEKRHEEEKQEKKSNKKKNKKKSTSKKSTRKKQTEE
ncbi:hypothetical protein HYV10_04100 [Candidatus Dependentiae bacterium]|nr:hypothetical protein [Candidatus Dependentiae bacterium]